MSHERFGLRPRHFSKNAEIAQQEKYATSTGSPFYKEVYGSDNKNVVFLLAPWHVSTSQLRPFARNLAERGFQANVYAYGDSVLSPDAQRTATDLTEIKNHVLGDIRELKDKEGKESFAVFGTSLGSVLGLMVANNSPEVSSVILNTTSAGLSDAIWSWPRDIRNGFSGKVEKTYGSLSALRDQWSEIDPINNLDNLKERNILIYLGKRDRDLPYSEGRRLVEAFAQRGISPQVLTVPFFNHGHTALINFLRPKQYVTFLKQNT